MPIEHLATLQTQAPFHIDDLLRAANQVLETAGLRPVQRRTLRFYIQKGVVAKPIGSPKYARYLYAHLLQLVGARSAQDQGGKLEQIKAEFDKCGNEQNLAVVVSRYLDARPTRRKTLVVAEEVANYYGRKIDLTPQITLTVDKEASVEEQLQTALDEIKKLLGKGG